MRYSAIEAVVPNLWAGPTAYMPSTDITINLSNPSNVPALPGWAPVPMAVLSLALSWFVRARRARVASR